MEESALNSAPYARTEISAAKQSGYIYIVIYEIALEIIVPRVFRPEGRRDDEQDQRGEFEDVRLPKSGKTLWRSMLLGHVHYAELP